MTRPIDDPRFRPGDIVVAAAPEGHFQVSRVAANGRSENVLGFQKDCPAALRMACRATSAGQRVYVWGTSESIAYLPHECD
jgi:hypothetical protein